MAELRRERSLTQERLSEATGVHRSYLAAVEAGGRNPTLDIIVRIAHGLGVPPADLLHWQ